MTLFGRLVFLAGASVLVSSDNQADTAPGTNDVSLLQATLELQQTSEGPWSPCYQREEGHSDREYCPHGSNDDCIRAYCQNLRLQWTGQWEHCADSWFGWV